jgi:hypothetical protein
MYMSHYLISQTRLLKRWWVTYLSDRLVKVKQFLFYPNNVDFIRFLLFMSFGNLRQKQKRTFAVFISKVPLSFQTKYDLWSMTYDWAKTLWPHRRWFILAAFKIPASFLFPWLPSWWLEFIILAYCNFLSKTYLIQRQLIHQLIVGSLINQKQKLLDKGHTVKFSLFITFTKTMGNVVCVRKQWSQEIELSYKMKSEIVCLLCWQICWKI